MQDVKILQNSPENKTYQECEYIANTIRDDAECVLNFYQNSRGQTSYMFFGVCKVTMATAIIYSTDCVG